MSSKCEVLRVVEALKFCDANGEVCPASWRKGEKGIKPEVVWILHCTAVNYTALLITLLITVL